jgi:eukaryotic-like serine/threonine-protein kinase
MNDSKNVPGGFAPKCPRCGGVLRQGVHAGLCPRCMLRSALVDEKFSTSGPTHFAGYNLLEKLGEGGMGVVYKARQLGGGDRIVALKRIRDAEFAERSVRRRFLAETRTIAELRHAHIVPIHEVGEYEDEPYFTMEFMRGGNLAQNAARHADPKQAAALIAKVARAAHAGHEKHIIHRDLKPANILFDDRDEPHIADFGLAKRLDKPDDLTTTGVVIGTACYMPPERASGGANRDTAAADIWSLGVLLYELVGRRRPFTGRSAFEILRHVVEDEPEPLDRVRVGVDADLVRICGKCLHKAPERRYLLAKTLAEELEQYVREQP